MNLCGKYRLSDHQRFDRIWGRSDPSPHPDRAGSRKPASGFFLMANSGQTHKLFSKKYNRFSCFCQKKCKFGTLQTKQDQICLIFNRMAFKGIIEVDTQKCKGCSVCIANCPTQSIQLSKMVNSKGYHYAEMAGEGCIGCANCAAVCPDSVITVYRVKI